MLNRYLRILSDRESAGFLRLKAIYEGGENLLTKRRKEAQQILSHCEFCEWKCGVNRYEDVGICRVPVKPRISSFFVHYGEESIIIPSFTIFFSGCNFQCVFCQNWDISQIIVGEYIEPKKMAKIIEEKRGIRNVNWVGGEPTPNLHYVLEVLENLNRNIPQIWNSNMYVSEKAMKLLEGVIDIYLTDFKYGNDSCAMKYSKVKNYVEIVKRNHLLAYRSGEVLIRHLVMPNHIECCTKRILDWIADNLPDAVLNLMAQYHPDYISYKFPEINRRLETEEYLEAYRYAKELNIKMIDEEKWLAII